MYTQEAKEALKNLSQLTTSEPVAPAAELSAQTLTAEVIEKVSAISICPAQAKFIEADKKAAADILFNIKLQLSGKSY